MKFLTFFPMIYIFHEQMKGGRERERARERALIHELLPQTSVRAGVTRAKLRHLKPGVFHGRQEASYKT